MKHLVLAAFVLLTGLSTLLAAPRAILDLDEVPAAGATLMWSPLFQASWEALREVQDGELEKVVPANPLIEKLETFKWQAEQVMPNDGYAVYAGPATQAFFDETAASIKQRFGIDMASGRLPVNPRGKSVYGVLLRELKFETKFFRSQQSGLDFQARDGEMHSVEFFGTAGDFSARFSRSVNVLHCDPQESSFSLRVATERDDEHLVIYLPNRNDSFRAAIDQVKQFMTHPLSGEAGSMKDGRLHANDVVKIPYLTIDADTDFTGQLGGELHYVGDPLPWRMAQAYQLTKFELFEDGARVRIETGAGLEPFGPLPDPPPNVPRSFICDRPFYVFLWRADADWPYLSVWVDGGDCFTRFTK